MRILVLFLFVSSILFSSSLKRIGVVPANVAYNIDNVSDFSELLYDVVLNAIEEYNLSQSKRDNLYELISEPNLSAQYIKNIKAIYKKINNDPVAYMNEQNLTKLITFDFNTKKINHMMRYCNGKCKVQVNFVYYSLHAKPVFMKSRYEYDGNMCALTNRSRDEINNNIVTFLNK